MSSVIDIHIQRSVVGTKIPFDKLYLFDREDREHIPKILGYALVLPFTAAMRKVLSALHVSEITHKGFKRDDALKKQVTTVEGKVVSSPADIHNWWEDFNTHHTLDNRVAVIPILTSIARKKIRPRYLANKQWFMRGAINPRRLGHIMNDPIPAIHELAYLATPLAPPQDKIRPLCSICPRMLLHLQGECLPGQAICYKSLDFSNIEDATENVSVQQDNS